MKKWFLTLFVTIIPVLAQATALFPSEAIRAEAMKVKSMKFSPAFKLMQGAIPNLSLEEKNSVKVIKLLVARITMDGSVYGGDLNHLKDHMESGPYSILRVFEQSMFHQVRFQVTYVEGMSVPRSALGNYSCPLKATFQQYFSPIGIDLANFDKLLMVAPSLNFGGTGWANFQDATVVQTMFNPGVIHELGHTFGFTHSNSNKPGEGFVHYGDRLCYMGAALTEFPALSAFNIHKKSQWMPEFFKKYNRTQMITEDGTYYLATQNEKFPSQLPFGVTAAQVKQALYIATPSLRWYSISYNTLNAYGKSFYATLPLEKRREINLRVFDNRIQVRSGQFQAANYAKALDENENLDMQKLFHRSEGELVYSQNAINEAEERSIQGQATPDYIAGQLRLSFTRVNAQWIQVEVKGLSGMNSSPNINLTEWKKTEINDITGHKLNYLVRTTADTFEDYQGVILVGKNSYDRITKVFTLQSNPGPTFDITRKLLTLTNVTCVNSPAERNIRFDVNYYDHLGRNILNVANNEPLPLPYCHAVPQNGNPPVNM